MSGPQPGDYYAENWRSLVPEREDAILRAADRYKTAVATIREARDEYERRRKKSDHEIRALAGTVAEAKHKSMVRNGRLFEEIVVPAKKEIEESLSALRKAAVA